MYENFDMEMQTPVDPDALERLLIETAYEKDKTEKIVNGFRHGFELGYEGRKHNIRRFAPNLKLRVGSELELWNKVMKEVKNKRFCGPYLENEIPFENFIQSLIGRVIRMEGTTQD